jgi:hypothetical protein
MARALNRHCEDSSGVAEISIGTGQTPESNSFKDANGELIMSRPTSEINRPVNFPYRPYR